MSLDQAPAIAYGPALAGADYGEAYLEETSWTSARLEDGRVQDVSAGSDRGLGLRLGLRHFAPWYWDAILLQDFFRLVLVNFHNDSWFSV